MNTTTRLSSGVCAAAFMAPLVYPGEGTLAQTSTEVPHVPQTVPEELQANAAPPVLKFDQSGNLLASWGGPDSGVEWMGREHSIFVDADDYVWIGGRAGWPAANPPGNSDDMIMKYSMDGVVYASDRINNRIQMFTREGEYLGQKRVTNSESDAQPVPAGFAFSPDEAQRFVLVSP